MFVVYLEMPEGDDTPWSGKRLRVAGWYILCITLPLKCNPIRPSTILCIGFSPETERSDDMQRGVGRWDDGDAQGLQCRDQSSAKRTTAAA